MKFLVLFILSISFSLTLPAQEAKIEWLDFETAVVKMKTHPKKMFIDMYTDWCGWCKKMDKETTPRLLLICKTTSIW
jgi:thioredoxin-related protein